MAEAQRLPVLTIPTPRRAPNLSRTQVWPDLHAPSHSRQVERIEPRLNDLQRVMQARLGALRDNPSNSEPELTVVFETRGPVESFFGAVKRIPELHWLAETISDGHAPDEDFYDRRNPERQLNGYAYLLLTNQRAVKKLLVLWKRYKESLPFAQGEGAWKRLFDLLFDARVWGVKDRLRETGVLEYWEEALQRGSQLLRTQIELWSPTNVGIRARHRREVEKLVRDSGGTIVRSADIPEIRYLSILADLPANVVGQVVDGSSTIDLVRADEVMLFRPHGQHGFIVNLEKSRAQDLKVQPPSELSPPVVALFDGVPVAQHILLSDRMVVDDPDELAGHAPTEYRHHGTAMASLILHGDLASNKRSLKSRLYHRPILVPNLEGPEEVLREGIPQDELPIDLVHRAVVALFEGGNSNRGAAPTVKIINLSIGDPGRPFAHALSPWARLLDWLSYKYKVLFIVSAGNHSPAVELDIPRNELEQSGPNEIRDSFLRAVFEETRLRRLLSPAEAINALTIGAEHSDGASQHKIVRRNALDPMAATDDLLAERLPSPLTAWGPGFKRAPKPEVFFPGGRQIYTPRLGNTHEFAILDPVESARPPGLACAAPGATSGQRSHLRYLCGTSNAAALASRAAAIAYENFHDEVDLTGTNDSPPSGCWPSILKALIVHASSWGDALDVIEPVARSTAHSKQMFRQRIGHFLGYGFFDEERFLQCNPYRVTLLRWGHLSTAVPDRSAHLYRIPLPPSLDGLVGYRRLTVTLAYLSRVRPGARDYRSNRLWFSLPRDVLSLLGVTSAESHRDTTARGTVQHEVFQGTNAATLPKGNEVELQVNCADDAGLPDTASGAVPYGLAVTLEVAPSLGVRIYEEVRDAIRARVQPAVRV